MTTESTRPGPDQATIRDEGRNNGGVWLDHPLRYWRGLDSKTRRQAIRFLFVGMLNTLFGYVIYAGLVLLGLHHAPALLLATILGVLFNFKTTGVLVFGSHDNRLIGRFIGAYTLIYLVNLALLETLILMSLNKLFAQALLLPCIALASFLVLRKWVFETTP